MASYVSRLISKSHARPWLLMWNRLIINRNYSAISNEFGKREGGLWSLGKLNHVAIATPDLEKSTQFYRDILGAKVSKPVALPEHGVVTVFVELENTKLELLLPLGENSPIKKFLETNKRGGIHHVCLEVDDIKSAMEFVKKNNIECLSKEPKIGAHGKPVVFLHPRDCSGVLVELEQA